MLPEQRKKQVLSWLETEEHIRISDLSERLEVSEMTVYRDVQALWEAGSLERTSGGVSKKLGQQVGVESNHCTYCKKRVHGRHQVQIIHHNHSVENLCCTHCGLLRYQEVDKQVSQFLCKDFLNDSTMSAQMAFFLIDADNVMNCCYPQVVPFAIKEHALKFQKGFGGELYQLSEALTIVNEQMNITNCCKDH
ncbi:DeoR family transcriptional regulator [Alteribacter populi]|uniref:DeoR family transcriptional regulator n=1 Tax=Alteribacter populi TaxID=2011011 RepID=UPI000BBAB38A|nr:DeoR family transcriptional regulator [Alteribacter populi]